MWSNTTAIFTRINGFLCPSDTPPGWPAITAYRGHGSGRNYFASVGSSLEFSNAQTGGPPNGLFSYIKTGYGRPRDPRGDHRRHEQHDRFRRMDHRRRQ